MINPINLVKLRAEMDLCSPKTRRWIILVVLFLVLLVWLSQVSTPAARPRGCFTDCGRAGRSEEFTHLRVLSFNMLHGFPDFQDLELRLELIATEIDRLQADVVLLQEVPWTLRTGEAAQVLARRLGMNYAYLRANGGRGTILFEEGEAILSRYPLVELRWTELRPAAGAFENRVALAALVETPAGPLWVVSTHLTTQTGAVKAGQSTALIRFVDALRNGPALVGGDFNQDPLALAKQASPPWDDPLGQLHPYRLTCCADDRRNPAETAEKAIDAILVAGGLPVLEAAGWQVGAVRLAFDRPFDTPQGGWLWLSDHMGILLELIGRR